MTADPASPPKLAHPPDYMALVLVWVSASGSQQLAGDNLATLLVAGTSALAAAVLHVFWLRMHRKNPFLRGFNVVFIGIAAGATFGVITERFGAAAVFLIIAPAFYLVLLFLLIRNARREPFGPNNL